uniref:Jacalin-type lectin domain-containing protein n=1 Tax=Oryza glaberrima TaxID=4538 RepID=I1PIS6_ORYGL
MGNFSGAEVVMIVAITICLYTFAFVSGIILAWGLDKKPPRASNSAVDRRRRLSSINNGNNAEDHHGRQAAAAVVVPRAVSTRPTTMNPISSPSSSMKIKLSADEQVTSVEGTIGRFRDVDEPVITSLTFRTNASKAYGPYGGAGDKQEGTHFSIPVDNGGVVVGFWGRAGWLIDAIGVYISPI